MQDFDYRRAQDAASAVATVDGDPGAVFLAGGTDLVELLRRDVLAPTTVVDVSRLDLGGVRAPGEGSVRIGATVRVADLAAEPLLRGHRVLGRAATAGSSGQARGLATVGGTLLQHTRCPGFTDLADACHRRAPGSGCAAVAGEQRRLAALDVAEAGGGDAGGAPLGGGPLGTGQRCVAVHPADLAVALVALDATAVVLGPDGERTVPLAELFRVPDGRSAATSALGRAELLTAVDVPALPAGAVSTYRVVRDRAPSTAALATVAAVLSVDRGTVVDVRLALGAVAALPWRARRAERALTGGPATREAFAAALELELAGAQPLPGSAFKLPLVASLAVSVLAGLVPSGRG